MKYAIVKVINGNFFIHTEGFTDVESAKVNYHALCQTLWNAQDVVSAYVMIADDQMNCVDGYKEFIHHEIVSE